MYRIKNGHVNMRGDANENRNHTYRKCLALPTGY